MSGTSILTQVGGIFVIFAGILTAVAWLVHKTVQKVPRSRKLS